MDAQRLSPVTWIHGSQGSGKSTLASLIAHAFGGVWLKLDLRLIGNDPRAAIGAWKELTLALVERQLPMSGVIIDDVTDRVFDALTSRIAVMVDLVMRRGARIILTSAFEPSPTRLASIGALPRASVFAPYLSIEEVSEIVGRPGGPSTALLEGWAFVVRLATQGHPLLVSSKVASLRARGWPGAALIEDFGTSSEAIQLTRSEARRRLLDEIPTEEARALLRRIASVYDRADDALIVKLASVAPRIANPTDHLSVLRGSWLDLTPDRRLRVSPLIADLSAEVDEHTKSIYRQHAALDWVTVGPLNEFHPASGFLERFSRP